MSLDDRLGWTHGSCLAIANQMLTADSPVTVVKLDGTSSVVDTRVVGLTSSDTICPALLEERRASNAQNGWFFYEIRAAPVATSDLGIAVAGNVTRIGERLDVNQDGSPDTFTQCSTSEGVRFDVWSGTPYQGAPLWSAYYYLGYDTEPTCPVGAPFGN